MVPLAGSAQGPEVNRQYFSCGTESTGLPAEVSRRRGCVLQANMRYPSLCLVSEQTCESQCFSSSLDNSAV